MTIRILNFPDGFSSPSQPEEALGQFKVYAVQTLEDQDTIDIDNLIGFQQRLLIGDGAVTVLDEIFGDAGGWIDGVYITLIGTSATNTVKIPTNDIDYGALINGEMTLGNGHSITLQWNESELRWFEISRNI